MPVRRRVRDLHPECRRARRDGAADAADADQPELLAAQLRAEHEVERPAFPLAAPHQPLAFRQAPRDREDQRPGEVGHRLGQHIRRVGDDDAARPRVGNVDVVVADARRWR